MTNLSKKLGIFHRFVYEATKGNEKKEMFLWDICYRYEVFFGACSSLLVLLIAYFLLPKGLKAGPLGFGLGLSFFSYFIHIPLRDTKTHKKREDIGQFSFLISNTLGLIFTLILLAYPVLYIWDYAHDHMIAMITPVIICYAIIFAIWIFAKDYVKWRFDWAVKNYDMLFSGHYKWWTSAIDYEVQQMNLKYFRAYKTHTTLILLAAPLCGLILTLASYYLLPYSSSESNQNRTQQTEASNSSQQDQAISNDQDAITEFYEETDITSSTDEYQNDNFVNEYTEDQANDDYERAEPVAENESESSSQFTPAQASGREGFAQLPANIQQQLRSIAPGISSFANIKRNGRCSGSQITYESGDGVRYQFFFDENVTSNSALITGIAISRATNDPASECRLLDSKFKNPYYTDMGNIYKNNSTNMYFSPGYKNGRVYCYIYTSRAPDKSPAPRD